MNTNRDPMKMTQRVGKGSWSLLWKDAPACRELGRTQHGTLRAVRKSADRRAVREELDE